MTYVKDVFGRDMFREMERNLIGFDRVFDTIADTRKTMEKLATSFPPYNIRKDGENKYTIELAVAGFGKQDIEIDLTDDKLVIKGKSSDNDAGEYLFKGLANRAFTRQFTLDDHIIVNNASLVNGILKIALERLVPESKKPRKINIEDEPSSVSNYVESNPQLLTETDMEIANGKLM